MAAIFQMRLFITKEVTRKDIYVMLALLGVISAAVKALVLGKFSASYALLVLLISLV
jgi:hypothetical protein